MQIDTVSQHILTLALVLEKISPGLAAELWVDEDLKQTLRQAADEVKSPETVIEETKALIDELKDPERRQYLTEILNSLSFQLNPLNRPARYEDFSQATFGFKISRVTEPEIRAIETKILDLEQDLEKSRQQVYAAHHLEKDELLPHIAGHIQTITNRLPPYLFNFPDEGVALKLTSKKPWSAFNSHLKPFQSEVILNAESGLTDLDLFRLACHEICGGHHTELSNKDQMLTVLNRGEHGIVITYSPQTFVSEAIAEAIFQLLGVLDPEDQEMVLSWEYTRLMFALQNLATFLAVDDGLPRQEIDTILKQYAVSDMSRTNILNFSLDPLLGRYAPVYYSAYQFLADLYAKTKEKNRLIKYLFSQPCTPGLLTKAFTIL